MRQLNEIDVDQSSTPDREAELKRQRIEKAAYLRAAARGFEAGDPATDWLEAEKEINESDGAESSEGR